MKPAHAWIDGSLRPLDEAQISAFDRGFQLGDGVFETLRARSGRVTELEAHLGRLRHSAGGLGIPLPPDSTETIARGIDEVLAAEELNGPDGDAAIRVTVTRGTYCGRGLLPPDEASAPTIVIQAWPVAPPPPGHLEPASISQPAASGATRRARSRRSRRRAAPTTSTPAWKLAGPARTTRCS